MSIRFFHETSTHYAENVPFLLYCFLSDGNVHFLTTRLSIKVNTNNLHSRYLQKLLLTSNLLVKNASPSFLFNYFPSNAVPALAQKYGPILS